MNEDNDFLNKISEEDFSSLLEPKIVNQPKEGDITVGKVVNIINNKVFIDVGLKTEGRIDISEFNINEIPVKIGDSIEVFVEKLENKHGSTQLSFKRVAKEKSWNKFEKACDSSEFINGKIVGKLMKGGFAVDLEGILAFLPSSQLDFKPVKDPSGLYNIDQLFKVLKIDRAQGNIVVSRRAILEESRKEAKEKLLSGIKEGMILTGTVKNITNYGAFIDLGDIDGLLHMSDISWNRISHPTEVLSLGQELRVKIIKFNQEKSLVSLGIKQLSDNPWEGMEEKFQVGEKYKGIITEINDFGVFVSMKNSNNVIGLVYPKEVTWNFYKNTSHSKLSINQEIEVMVLEIDIHKHRLSLSIKKCLENPWEKVIKIFPEGSKVSAEVIKIIEFGLLVKINSEKVDGNMHFLVPATEIDWSYKPKEALSQYKIGDKIDCVVLSSDIEKEKITLSIKRLDINDLKKISSRFIQKDAITCTIYEVLDSGLRVEVEDEIKGFIKKSDLSKDKSQHDPARFAVGDRIDAKAISFDKTDRVLRLSIKQLEIIEERKAISAYGNTVSGASLAEILGEAFENEDNKKNKK